MKSLLNTSRNKYSLNREPQNHENRENVFEVENTKLTKENRLLKNRFEQVRVSYNELEKEAQEVKKHYEEELSEARSNFENIKSELEQLRDSNVIISITLVIIRMKKHLSVPLMLIAI